MGEPAHSGGGSRRPSPALVVAFAVTLTVAVVLAGALLPAGARADGDPASDVLVSQSLFLPYDTGVSGAREARLQALLTAAAHAGFPIRVALIPSEYDLGSVGVLWRRPSTYARFLGIELSLAYGGRLLVVMPNGLGFDWPHHSAAAAYEVLAKIGVGHGGDAMLAATESAVRRLAAAAGVSLAGAATGKPSAGSGAGTGSGAATGARAAGATDSHAALIRLLFALLVLAVAVALAATVLIFVRDLRRGEDGGRSAEGGPEVAGSARPSPAGGVVIERRSPVWSRVLPRRPGTPRALTRLIGGAAVLSLCAAVPIALVGGGGSGSGSGSGSGTQSARSETEETPTTFPRGQRAAPNFDLTDQRGRGVSLDAYRGRPVLVTFIDPLCRNQCPLAAKILSEADRRLPAALRPEIIAVSVDVYADSRADLDEDYSRWSLVSQWQWAVGSPRRLAAVWRRYYAEVEVQTKHIAGTTVHYITHSEMAYLVDGDGYERALFSWPFSEREVDDAVRGLGRS
ncbi:MAG TPA: SCO family protein [Solirubrobacteraceae bacterium]|nr:SCO family protein [Solirubrobacteraceae bacterium]